MKIIKTNKYSQKDSNALQGVIQSYIDFVKTNPIYEGEESYNNDAMITFFETLIDGIKIEELHGEKLRAVSRDVIQHIQYLESLPSGDIEDQKNYVLSIYKKHYNTQDPVRNSLFYMDSIPEVDEWLNKNSKFRNYGR